MDNTFPLQQISRTINHDAYLVSRQNKLNVMADYKRMKYENLKLKQSEIVNQLGYYSSTLRRYRNDTNMLSPYRIQPNNANKQTKKASNTFFGNNSLREYDLKRPRLNSNDLNTTSNRFS